MARQIIWSLRAQNDKKEILDYWRRRNKSDTYSKKLNALFKESIKILKDFPQIGKETDDHKVRIKIVKNYFIIYEETQSQILILTIWDSRQDPDKLSKILQ
jgi:plasmid stabilization system protein ParE